MSLNVSIGDSIERLNKALDCFRDFKPETRTMTIDFTHGTSSVGFMIKVDEGFRKRRRKITIPAHHGFSISNMMDATFNQLVHKWEQVDGHWVLEAKELPPSNGYFLILNGRVERKTLDGLVHIKPSINRDSDGEVDRYWLDASLKNTKMLESAWEELSISEVGVGIKIDINKLFGLMVPQSVKDKAVSTAKFLQAANSNDRNRLFNAWRAYKTHEKATPFKTNDFLEVIKKLTARNTLLDYMSVDKNYGIGEITHPTKYEGIIPQDVKVQALTTLTLKNPQSMGYLILKRQSYIEKIREEFNKIVQK